MANHEWFAWFGQCGYICFVNIRWIGIIINDLSFAFGSQLLGSSAITQWFLWLVKTKVFGLVKICFIKPESLSAWIVLTSSGYRQKWVSVLTLVCFFCCLNRAQLSCEVTGEAYLRRLVRSPKSSSLGCMNCQTTGTVNTTTSPMVAQIATV